MSASKNFHASSYGGGGGWVWYSKGVVDGVRSRAITEDDPC